MRKLFLRISSLTLTVLVSVSFAFAQISAEQRDILASSRRDITTTNAPDDAATPAARVENQISALEELLRRQAEQIEALRQMLEAQQKEIHSLSSQLASISPVKPNEEPASTSSNEQALPEATQALALEQRLKSIEEKVLKLGPFKLSGDFRIRADGVFRSATKPPDPPLPHLQNVRATYRFRLNFDTDIYPTLSFHGQLATGAVNNQLSTNQEFSSIGVRHPFFLNEAWIDYHPNNSVQLQAGRVQNVFADNSRFIFDDDVRFNGFNEKYVWWLKNKPAGLSSIEFRAGQYILTNPNVAVIAPGSPLSRAGEIVGSTGRSATLFHQGLLVNQAINKGWTQQFGGDVQLYRHPNQIQLASSTDGLVLLIQPGIGLALSGPIGGVGNATTTPGGAIYSAGAFRVGRLTYRLSYAGFRSGDHIFPITINLQVARNLGTAMKERDALLATLQVGRITKKGDMSLLYYFTLKGANSIISQLTDDDLGVGSGVNVQNNHFRFEYGIAKKVVFQSLFYFQRQLRSSGQHPNFFVPLGAYTPRTFRFQQQLVFSF